MKGVSQFQGALRAVNGLAQLTMRELVRTGAAPISFFLFLIFIGVFSADETIEVRAASARLIDHGLGGFAVTIVFLALFFGMQLAARGTGSGHASVVLRRSIGPAAWYWGRLVGMTAVLVLLGLLGGAVVVMHHSVRFGGSDATFQLENRIVSPDFTSSRDTRYMRRTGDKAEVTFELDGRDISSSAGPGTLVGRFAPTLVLLSEGGAARATCPIRIEIRDAEGDWSKRRLLRINEGRAQRFEVPLPRGRIPEKVIVTLENRSPSYLVKFRQSDLQFVTHTRSFTGGIMRASLALALLAAVLASMALFLREHLSFGPALIAAFGLAVVSVSVELLEFSVLTGVSSAAREAVLAVVTTLLPDFGSFDVIQRLARGRDVGWDISLDLLVRLVSGGILLGVVSGWAGARRVRS